ncbi:DUF1127 domain-containing protein [Roseibium limicola]|uniref:DUF1127 domain-containing protein n=1 Tax=Roseibium limicola TaxID=2816037 RepID=A0A939EP12_9HYPH|nr:DUF1127 domain-containing protein [Roseibium limicola]MBO0346285.1 DUF1127 domain-containing protein [Roseibium limicola]
MLDTFVRKYQTWKRYRTTYDELSQLSNRELQDLGINRGELSYFARSATR